MCLVLERMTYPRRWADFARIYNRHIAALSRVFMYMIDRILAVAKGQIMFAGTVTPERLHMYMQAFWRRGVPRLLRMWSVIDVKKVANCRPTQGQRAQYSGHTKYHCFKYQTLETPDGMAIFWHRLYFYRVLTYRVSV